MKRHLPSLFPALCICCLSASPLFSQDQSNFQKQSHQVLLDYKSPDQFKAFRKPEGDLKDFIIRFGITGGSATGNGYNYAAGGDFTFEKPVIPNLSVTASAGFTFYQTKPDIGREGFVAAPFKGGVKFQTNTGFYLKPEIGYAVGVNHYAADGLVYGAAIGKDFSNGWGLNIRYEKLEFDRSWNSSRLPSAEFVGLQLSYSLFRGHFASQNLKPATAPPAGKKQTYIFAEFGGAGILAVNFDQRFQPDRTGGFGFRVGLGGVNDVITLPVGISHIAGKGRSTFESGVSLTALYDFHPGDEFGTSWRGKQMQLLTLVTAGYRLQSHNGFMLRLNNSISYQEKRVYYLHPGISIGYRIR